MFILKRLIKIFIIISIFLLFIPISKEINIKIKTNKIIKEETHDYLGYIYIPKYDYKNIIDNKDNTLDENKVLLPNFSDNIGENIIILAGHNNRYVFNKIYYLDIGDEIIISDFNVDYEYKVVDKYIIKVDDFSTFNEDNTLYLMTCTNNNQERFIVKTKKDL